MKIMQINSYYDYGSTGKIVKDIADFLVDNNEEIYICYAWETNFTKSNKINYFKYANTFEKYLTAGLIRITGNRYGYSFISTYKLLNCIQKVNPDVIHIHCPNSFDVNLKLLINYLKKHKIKTTITEHAEFYHTGNCPYSFECDKWLTGCSKCSNLFYSTKSVLFDRSQKNWNEMKNAFTGFDNCKIVSVSPWLEQRTKQSPITKNIPTTTIENGIDCSKFKYINKELIEPEIKNLFDDKTFLFVTSNLNSQAKGFNYFLELVNILKDYNFIIICKEKFDFSKYKNVKHIDYINTKEELAKYYSLAKATLLFSKRETFSMITAESLCCGTPIVGFFAGGPESIAINEYSCFSEYGNLDKIIQNIEFILNKNFSKKLISSQAINKYSSINMAKKYYNLYKE